MLAWSLNICWNKTRLFFYTRSSTSKMISNFCFIIFQNCLFFKFLTFIRIYPQIWSHSNKRRHWIFIIGISSLHWYYVLFFLVLLKWLWCLSWAIISSSKISLTWFVTWLLHLPCIMMLVMLLVNKNIITTINFDLDLSISIMKLLIILYLTSYLWTSFIFIILWFY